MPPATRILPDWFLRSRLKMRQVLLLVALDEQRNMHRAAASLRMTQPAATRLLGGLERMLGLRLFERGPRGLTPNAYGESLIRHARAMLATLDHAREEMNSLAEGASGRVAIGALLVAAPVLVPRALARFKQRHPHHTVLVQEGSATALLPALRRGELDLVVGRVTSDVPGEGLEFETFYNEPMQVVARAGHPLGRRRALALADLAGEMWIVPAPDAPYRRRLDAAFRQAGVAPPRRLVESVSIAVNKMLVQGSDMLGVMPRTVAREYAALGLLRVLPVKLPPPSGPVGVITATGPE
ncbi:MAG: LysR family transcriptional regulator, partial [Betaproteobacteria bacterium]|nr:LysR family transcriptional regulator [Betaproteobacteria bacterium]